MTDAAPPPGPAPPLSHMAAQLDRRLRRERRLRWLYFALLLIPVSSIVLTLVRRPESGGVEQASTAAPPASTPEAPPAATTIPPAQVPPRQSDAELREEVRKTQATVARLERELEAVRRAGAEDRVATSPPATTATPAAPASTGIRGTGIVATVPIRFAEDGSVAPGTRTEIAETVSRLRATAGPTRFEVVAAIPDGAGGREKAVLRTGLAAVRAYLQGTLGVAADAIEVTMRAPDPAARRSAIELKVWR